MGKTGPVVLYPTALADQPRFKLIQSLLPHVSWRRQQTEDQCEDAPDLVLLLDGDKRSRHDQKAAAPVILLLEQTQTPDWAMHAKNVTVVKYATPEEIAAQITLHLEQARLKQECATLTRQMDKERTAQAEMMTALSHEFRTPMNGVIGMAQILMGSSLSPEQREYVETINQSSITLVSIFQDFLNYAVMKHRDIEFAHKSFDLHGCIESVADILAPRAREKNLVLATLIGSGVPQRIIGDPVRLRQVILNLANNAVRFTQSGEVTLRCRALELGAQSIQLEFEVCDTGVAMPTERVETFEAFQSDAERLRAAAGLGLAMSRHIADAMKGELNAYPNHPNGVRFHFRVAARLEEAAPLEKPVDLHEMDVLIFEPHDRHREALLLYLHQLHCRPFVCQEADELIRRLGAAQADRAEFGAVVVDIDSREGASLRTRLRTNPQAKTLSVIYTTSTPRSLGREPGGLRACRILKPYKLRQLLDVLKQSKQRVEHTPLHKERLPVAPKDMSILLVEDNLVNRKVAVRMLARDGYHCDIAVNGRECLEALAKKGYQLILMDIQMPEMDGLEATRRIRKHEAEIKEPPKIIIAMTANALAGDREKCLAAGMDDYIAKPIQATELFATLEKYQPKNVDAR